MSAIRPMDRHDAYFWAHRHEENERRLARIKSRPASAPSGLTGGAFRPQPAGGAASFSLMMGDL